MKPSIEALVFTFPARQNDQLDFMVNAELGTYELKLMHINQILWRRSWGGPIREEVGAVVRERQ